MIIMSHLARSAYDFFASQIEIPEAVTRTEVPKAKCIKMVVFEKGSAFEANFDKVNETINNTINGFQVS